MSLTFIAAALPLIAIGADDERLHTKRTFVSEEARMEITRNEGGRVLCLDREGRQKRFRSICLTEVQWRKTIALAETQQRSGRRGRDFIPIYQNNLGLLPHPVTNY